MELEEYVFQIARVTDSFNLYTYSFINQLTDRATIIQVKGITLASKETKNRGIRTIECILMLDNGQFFYCRQDTKSRIGKYSITNTLKEIERYNPAQGLIAQAMQNIRLYPDG